MEVVAYVPADAGIVLCPDCAADYAAQNGLDLTSPEEFGAIFEGAETDYYPVCDMCQKTILDVSSIEAWKAAEEIAEWCNENEALLDPEIVAVINTHDFSWAIDHYQYIQDLVHPLIVPLPARPEEIIREIEDYLDDDVD